MERLFPIDKMSRRKKVKDKMVTSIRQVTIPDYLPEFFKIYHPQICNFQLRIPPAFLKFFNGDIPANYMLEDLARRSWKVVVEKNDNDLFFMGGWPDFVRNNNLKFGEILTFSYTGNSHFYVKIYGINGSLKRDVTAINEPELHPLDEEIVHEIGTSARGYLVVSVTSFDIVIKPSYIRKKHLNVPAAFGNRYLNRVQGQNFEATLQTDRGSWPVSVHSSDRLLLRTGFGEFIAGNALREGDVCQFKLIDEANFILEVSIRRQLK